MELVINNQQEAVLIDLPNLEARIRRISNALELDERTELSLVICDDPYIAELNGQYLGKPHPTNVISFPMQEGEDSEFTPHLLGDIVVSIDTAHREAAENDLDPGEHFVRLIIHGLLHLLGYDHIHDENEARRMEELTEQLLERSA